MLSLCYKFSSQPLPKAKDKENLLIKQTRELSVESPEPDSESSESELSELVEEVAQEVQE